MGQCLPLRLLNAATKRIRVSAACAAARAPKSLGQREHVSNLRRSRAEWCFSLERFGRLFRSDRSVELSRKKVCLKRASERQKFHESKKSLEIYQHLSLGAVEQAYQEAVQGVSIQWTPNDARITGL
jgi:hypothetical protein